MYSKIFEILFEKGNNTRIRETNKLKILNFKQKNVSFLDLITLIQRLFPNTVLLATLKLIKGGL
jgi:hypothetical protein